jgi:hypothetical protein
MPPSRPTESAVEAVLQSGPLSVSGRYAWEAKNNGSWVIVRIPVSRPESVVGELRIVVNISRIDPNKRDFTLLFDCHRVRALCIGGNHENRHTNNERWIRQIHKHKWSDICGDRFAYTPTDITAIDLQGEFAQLCAECSIACNVILAPLPLRQEEIVDDLC